MSSTPQRPRHRRWFPWLLGLIVLVGAGYGAKRFAQGPVVDCVMPRRGQLIDKVVLTGRVITPGVSQLGVATLGTVASVLVDAGSRVTSGQLLLRLDDTEQR